MSKAKKTPSVGQLVNKLENAIAIANMRGDKSAAAKLQKVLEAALNATQMREVVA